MSWGLDDALVAVAELFSCVIVVIVLGVVVHLFWGWLGIIVSIASTIAFIVCTAVFYVVGRKRNWKHVDVL